MATKKIDDWREDVLVFLSTTIKSDRNQITLKKGAADLVHEIGYFFDHHMKDYPNSLTSAQQLEITAAVINHIHDRLPA